MSDPVFNDDVFLSHSAKDKTEVRPLAGSHRDEGPVAICDLEVQ